MKNTLRPNTLVVPVSVEHAFCNTHHPRESSRLLTRAAKYAQRAVAQGRTSLSAGCARRHLAVYDAIIRRGLACREAQPPLLRRPVARGKSPKRLGHNLLERLRDYTTEVLRIMPDFAVPFTINQAGRTSA